MSTIRYHGGPLDGMTEDNAFPGRSARMFDGFDEHVYDFTAWDEETDTVDATWASSRQIRERPKIGPRRDDDPLPQEALDTLDWLNRRLGDS